MKGPGFCLAYTATMLLPLLNASAAAPGRQISGDYAMTADGVSVDVIRVPAPEPSSGGVKEGPDRQPYSYAAFSATGRVSVCVRSSALDLLHAKILPASKGVVARSQSEGSLTFEMTPPMTLVVEPKGRHRALVVSANLPDPDPPQPGDRKVKYFGPGVHRADRIALDDGETLYLAPGAWVEGFVLGRGRDITIRGSGVLSGACWDWHKGPPESRSFNESGTLVTLSGEDITLRDVTLFSSWGWTLVFNCVTNALVDNVKVIGGRVINDDGIDICRAKGVVVRNSFVRGQDDCVTPKYWCEDFVCTNLTLWTDAANAFRTGYECERGASGLVYRNLLFRDIDILHLALRKTHPEKYWANCAIYIQPANGQPMYDTLYEDIRFHEVGPEDVLLNVKTMPITQGSSFCRTDEAGRLKGLTLRNIHLPDSQGGMCVNLSAFDDAHPIEDVRFENVMGYGNVTKSGNVGFSSVDHVTALFPQSQLKYGAQRDDFLHRWYERPLHQDTSFADAPGKDFLNVPAWHKTVEALQLGGFDGVSYFASYGNGRDDVLAKSLLPGAETRILFEISGYAGVENSLAAAEKALKQPNYYRIDGRVVLPLRGQKGLECTPEFAAEFRRRLTEKFGDRFLVLPYGVVFAKGSFNGGRPTAESIAAAKGALRALLRASDGFFYQGREAVLNRRLDPAALAVATSVIRDVFAEDEFRGKKRLGVGIAGGHENTYRWQYTLDSTGTAHLADSLADILPLKPDIVKCMEWDEENENTFFRPTVFNGFTHLRLTRWFKDVANGRRPSVFPGDDTSVPNLVLSYRKSLVAGEPIEVEVRNIPDGTFADETFRVVFAWKDADGRTVRTFAPQTLKADEMSAVWFKVPAAELIANRILLPELAVTSSSGVRTFADGLFPLDLNATRTLDHKWVKQALREQTSGVTGTLEIGESDETGAYAVRGSVASPKRIRSIEVLDDMDSAYVHAPVPAVPADCEQIRIGFSGFGNNKKANGGVLNGTIRFDNAPGATLLPYNRGSKVKVPAKDGAWTLKDVPCDNWGGVLWAHVPKAACADGKIVVDLAPHFTGTVKLAGLLKKDVVGFNSVRGCGLTVMRYLPTAALPRPLMEKEARFAFRWKPLEKTSVLRLQVIDEDYHVWRGPVKTVFRPCGRTVTLDVFDRETGKAGAVTVDAARVETVSYGFDGSRGSAFVAGSGRMLSGMVGASAELAQAFGRGESHYGNPLSREIGKPYLKNVVAPASGWGCLSLQAVPGFAGFALEMKVKPDGFGARQGLFSSGNCGLDLYLDEKGAVRATLSRGYSFFAQGGALDATLCGAALRDGEWNTIRLVTDRRTAWLEVNGVRGEPIAYEDYFPNQRYTLFGASHPRGDFFRGQIGFLGIRIGR